jgi:hypothetical protein
MHRILFKNRFYALVFVAITLFSVRILVGTDNERGALEKATEQFTADKPVAAATPERARPASQPVATIFASDEELIDDAEGLDPSGWSSEPEIDHDPGLEKANSTVDGNDD